jgi:hypothetical protein
MLLKLTTIRRAKPTAVAARALLAVGAALAILLPQGIPASAMTFAKGSTFSYVPVISPNRTISTAGQIKYSWSWMWYINNSIGTINNYSSFACSMLPIRPAQAGCFAIVQAYLAYAQNMVRKGIAAKQCLVFRFPMAPLPAWTVMNMSLTKCTV